MKNAKIKVSPEDVDLLAVNWSFANGYATKNNSMRGRRFLHRLVAERSFGSVQGRIVDHVNQDKLDNRRENLRLVSPSENSFNSKDRKTKSGYRWVRHETRNCWSARVKVSGKFIYLGTFRDPKVAHEAAKTMLLKVRGELPAQHG